MSPITSTVSHVRVRFVFRSMCAAATMLAAMFAAVAERPLRLAAQGVPIEDEAESSSQQAVVSSIAASEAFTDVADAVFVAAGNEHSCLLTSSGAVKCWGRNNFGQLGNGTKVASATPVQVSGLSSGVKSIALGANHGCAVTEAGAVQCWGSNSDGQLGDGTATDRLLPTKVADLQALGRGIAAGARHTCVMLVSGPIYCWGNNIYRQLGDATGLPAFKPKKVSGLSADALSAGRLHTCALTTARTLACWGRNNDGQLGNGAYVDSASMVTPSGFITVGVFAAGGAQSCAADVGGPLQCWGSNLDGQLGNGELTGSSVPVDVLWLDEGVAQLAIGGRHACARMSDSSVKCWGDNEYGQLGDGTQIDASAAVQVQGYATGFASISAGQNHTCGLLYGGGAACWGLNDKGQLGIGSFVNLNAPVKLPTLPRALHALASGGQHTCAAYSFGKSSSTLCWGSNHYGQLGYGQLGVGAAISSPTPLWLSIKAAWVLAAGSSHSCGVNAQGGRCWGSNSFGQLGNGAADDAATPVAVLDIVSTTKMLAAGGGHTCAVTGDDAVVCWGQNNFGQLGINTTVSATSPAPVQGFASGALAVTAGGQHTCGLTSVGAAYCWGINFQGELGSGSNSGKLVPFPVVGIGGGATRIDAGAGHTCAVVQGAVKCWGTNGSGQLGDGTTAPSNVPVAVVGLQAGVADVTAGGGHTCALTTAGTVRCWGWNGYGQLGSGDGQNALQPVKVADLIEFTKVRAPAVYR